MKERSFSAMWVAAFFLPQFAVADQVTLDALKDNTLYEDGAGATSNGAGIHFFAGRTGPTGGGAIRRGVIAFDIAGSIPAGATIESVTLTLNMSKTISGAEPIALHRLTQDWGEGTSDAPGQEGGGAAATPGDATWLHTFSPSSFWFTAGGDFAGGASATTMVDTLGPYTWGSTAAMVVDVQNWLDNPADNFGWILLGNEAVMATTKRFDTREMTQVANRPQLLVTFSAFRIPATSEWGLVALALVVATAGTVLIRRRRPHVSV